MKFLPLINDFSLVIFHHPTYLQDKLRRGLQHGLPQVPRGRTVLRNQVRVLRVPVQTGLQKYIFLMVYSLFRDFNTFLRKV